MSYYVICREDTRADGSKGKYVLATSRSFGDWDKANTYTGTINSSREPKVLMEQDGIERL
jgi:hypothetical protein